MKVKIKHENDYYNLCEVEKIIKIPKNLTLCEELENSILIIHKTDHVEKYRLFKNAEILSVEDK